MDDINHTSSRIIEEIQQGLKNLDEEEENLVLLRGQLSKVKRFREEQAKKDEIIATLKERVACLEYEKEFSQRQSAELEEIMSERIVTLEHSLLERDEVEKQFLEFQVQAEIVEMDRDSLKGDLEAERQNHDQTRMECTNLSSQVHRLESIIEIDQQAAHKTKVLFDTLKSELQKKELTLSNQTSSNKETVKQLTKELAVSRKAVEDMAEKLILLEEEKQSCQNALQRASADLGLSRQEAAHQTSEVSRWSHMYNELEKVLSTMKAQTAMSHQSYAHEVSTLQSDLAYHKKEHDRLRAELTAFSTTLTSITTDISSIATTKAPTTMNQINHYRAEVVGALKSMRRYVSKLDDSFVPNAMFKKIVSFIDEMAQTSLAYQEGLAESCSSNHEVTKKTTTLEEQVASMKRDLVYADTAVEHLIQQFQAAGFLYAVDTTDLRAANRKSARIDTIGSEYRIKLYEELQLGVTAALRKVTDFTAAQEDWVQKDVAHHAELRESLETMRQMKEKYSTEIGHLHRMNEEALVAVRVAEYESGTEINRLREEYRTKYTQETGDMSARLQQLQAVVDASSAKYTQVALSLQHLLAYTVPLQAQLANLSKAYNTLKLLHQHSEKVTDGILSLAQCCRPQSTGVTTSEHSAAYKKDKGRGGMMLRGEYVFEPFLDPLEEVSAQRVHVKVTFRVAVIYVLAALRFQNILRVEKEYADEITSHLTAARSRAKESTGGVELSISLPAEKDLRALSSVQIARQLLDGAKSVAGATESPGNHLHLHQRMSMDEFDVYLANYERNFERRTSTSPGRAGKGSPLRKSKVSLFEALVSPNLRAAQQGSAATASSNIYHLRNVSLLYKTLSDMSNRVFKCGAENEQLQTIVASLEHKVRTQEKHITRLDIALKNATAKEEQLLTQIDQMERDKRSKSWHILKEIHQELRQDIGTSDSSSVRRAPQQPGSFEAISSPTSTLPGRFPLPSMPSVPNTSNSATSTLSAELNLTKATTPLSPVEAPHDSGDLLDISAVNMTAPTPPPVPRPVPNSHAAMTTTTTTTTTRNTASSSASNIVNTSRGVSHTSVANETFDEDVAGAATAADQSSGGGYSMYDSYELFSPANAMTTAQTPERGDKHGAFATERTIDSISKSEIFSSPADISWDQNDSFNARFTGTDKGIHHHQSAHVHYDVRRSGDSHHSHSQSHIYPSSDVSLGSRDDFGGGLLSATHPPSTNTSHVDYSQFDATLRRGQSALGAHSTPTWLPTGRRSGGEIDTNSTWLDRQTLGQGQKQSVGQLLPSSTSNGNPARRAVEERHAEEVQAIYSDIGRLSGRLESRLNKSASPEDVLRAYSYGTVGGGGGGPYGYSRSGQHK